ncbi:MAG: hypothetical protein HY280_11245 [Nitrospinae bacterium]|nr:hypothetical protein [Nitrospinota bacterium]
MKKLLFAVLAMSLFVILPRASSAEQGYYMGYDVGKSSKGLSLKLSTNMPVGGMWVGVTVYSPKGKNLPVINQMFPLKQGNGTIEVDVDPTYKDGTFEAAIYAKKLSREECLATDEACQKAGYRLAYSTSYTWGYLSPQ